MPVHFLASAVSSHVPTEYWASLGASLIAISFLKTWSHGTKLLDKPVTTSTDSSGAFDSQFNDLHGRVVLVASGAFSPVGVVTISALAHRGAQVIALTKDISSPDTLQLIHLLRDSTRNELIYAEECDIGDLDSINKFASAWNQGDKKQPEGVRRLDALMFLPPTRTELEVSGIYQSLVLGKFHLINSILSSLLLLPPDREVRIISSLSPFYAAGATHFDNVATGKGSSYSASVGAASLRWYALSIELQRRLNLLAEADPRPRTKLPGIDPTTAQTTRMPNPEKLLDHQHARTSNIVLLNVCPGFERNADVLETFLPRPRHPMTSTTDSSSFPPSEASNGGAGVRNDRKNKTKKSNNNSAAILEQELSKRTTASSVSSFHLLWYQTKAWLRFLILLVVWPIVWLLSKSPATASESVVWITLKKLETQNEFIARLQRQYQQQEASPSAPGGSKKAVGDGRGGGRGDGVLRWDDPLLPTELYREGRIVRPRLPDRFFSDPTLQAKLPLSTNKAQEPQQESEFSKLWTHEEKVIEEKIIAMGGKIMRPKI